jgi:hypothetical protein
MVSKIDNEPVQAACRTALLGGLCRADGHGRDLPEPPDLLKGHRTSTDGIFGMRKTVTDSVLYPRHISFGRDPIAEAARDLSG